MTNMRAVQIDEIRKPMTLRDIAVPEIGDDDVLVRVTASGICRTDWHLWNGDWGWSGVKLGLPMVLGHEIAGVLEKVGSNVTNLRVGQRVCVPFNFACGHCTYCHKGTQNLCDNASWAFLTTGSGGFAEYARVPNARLNCMGMPDDVTDLDGAALGCRYMTAYRAVRTRADVRGGETVAVVGIGGVGRSAVQIAAAFGGQVIAIDHKPAALEAAKKIGAIEVINSSGLTPEQVAGRVRAINGGKGVDVAIDAVAGQNATLTALKSLAKGGRLVVAGLTSQEEKGELTMPIDVLVLTELSMIGTLGNPHGDYPELLGLVGNGKLQPSKLLDREVALEDVQSVFNQMPKFDTNGFVVVTKFN
jgi:D-arabinose 1-dehydrogenase-like Zn-dependent alcohol dehydrogenase